jgi:transposase
LAKVALPDQDLDEETIGEGFELELGQHWRYGSEGEIYGWMERQLVVRSAALAQQQHQGLEQRLEQAEGALIALAKRCQKDCCVLQESVN